MNILILEDRGSVSFFMVEALKQRGHNVFSANTTNEATEFWNEQEIDCLIVDLNMSPEGLSKEQAEKTRGGLLTGWVWLQETVFNTRPEMRPHTIIYSEYTKELKSGVKDVDLEGISIIPKKAPTSTAEQVLEALNKISQKIKEGGK